jgi:hypothetical protein
MPPIIRVAEPESDHVGGAGVLTRYGSRQDSGVPNRYRRFYKIAWTEKGFNP